jgi:hypothetical protein
VRAQKHNSNGSMTAAPLLDRDECAALCQNNCSIRCVAAHNDICACLVERLTLNALAASPFRPFTELL